MCRFEVSKLPSRLGRLIAALGAHRVSLLIIPSSFAVKHLRHLPFCPPSWLKWTISRAGEGTKIGFCNPSNSIVP